MKTTIESKFQRDVLSTLDVNQAVFLLDVLEAISEDIWDYYQDDLVAYYTAQLEDNSPPPLELEGDQLNDPIPW